MPESVWFTERVACSRPRALPFSGGSSHGRLYEAVPHSRPGHCTVLGEPQGARYADPALRRLRAVHLLPAVFVSELHVRGARLDARLGSWRSARVHHPAPP